MAFGGCTTINSSVGARVLTEPIRDMSSQDLELFGKIVAQLERLDSECDVRKLVFEDIVKLTRADFGASFVWHEHSKQFRDGLIYNMDPGNIGNYNKWFQYCDPHTLQLRALKRAAYVEEITPYSTLETTEFYNDFLKRDGLHHGVNLFLFDGPRDLGDFRLWRAKNSPDFTSREVMMLDALAPFLRRALIKANQRFDSLTLREREVAFLVARGMRDRDICGALGIGFATVRTHLNNAMTKKGCANRAELAASIMSEKQPTAEPAAAFG